MGNHHAFIVDGMLGSLARWLRIAGYDSIYIRGMDDDRLLEETKDSARIMLTRDRELYQRALKFCVKSIFFESEELSAQFTHLKMQLGLKLVPSNSRCPICNGLLAETPKDDVQELVPAESFKVFDEFWVCGDCSRVYWKGSHWVKIMETLGST